MTADSKVRVFPGRISPDWSGPELAVFARYLRALEEGRYALVTEAAGDCERELAQLYRQHPGESWAAVRRGPDSVCWKLGELAREAGRMSHGRPLSPQEVAVVKRFVPAVVRGDYRTLGKAAADIRAEFERRRRTDPHHFAPRGIARILAELARRVRRKGWTVTGSRLSRDERRLLDRHARRLLKQERPALREAALECHAGMETLWRRNPALGHKAVATVYMYLGRRLRELGKPPANPKWTQAEDRVLTPYARGLVEGRYGSAPAAAQVCVAERPSLLGSRRMVPIEHRIIRLARGLRVPRPGADFTPAEERILNEHAQAAADGRYPSSSAAARACFWALHRYYSRLRRERAGSIRRLAGRTYPSIRFQVLSRARTLGRQGPPNRHWSPAEELAAHKWLRRHRRFCRHAAHWTLADAARSLHDELERHDYSRTLEACWQKLSYMLRGKPRRSRSTMPPSGEGKARGSHSTR